MTGSCRMREYMHGAMFDNICNAIENTCHVFERDGLTVRDCYVQVYDTMRDRISELASDIAKMVVKVDELH